MKKVAVFLMALLLVTAVSACSRTKKPMIAETEYASNKAEQYSLSESKTEAPEVSVSGDSVISSDTENVSQAVSEADEEQSVALESNTSTIIPNTPKTEAPNTATSPADKPTAPASETEKAVAIDSTPTAEPIKTEPPSEPPVQEPEPQPEPTTTEEAASPPAEESAFDISYWVKYAKDYAVSVGLQLHEEAVYCWDNPISANAKCLHLERDIQSRLNRYAGDEEITLVWIWTVELSEGNYEIYIGYA